MSLSGRSRECEPASSPSIDPTGRWPPDQSQWEPALWLLNLGSKAGDLYWWPRVNRLDWRVHGALAYLPHLLRGRKSNLLVLFIFGCTGSLLLSPGFLYCSDWGLPSSCGPQASHCGGIPCCGSWTLDCRLSRLAHGLRCPEACGILQDQGSNPCTLHGQVDSQPLDHQRSPKPTSVLVWSQAGYSFFSFRNLSRLSWCPDHSRSLALGPWILDF